MLRLERQRGRTREYWQLELDGTSLVMRSGKGTSKSAEKLREIHHETTRAAQADAYNKFEARLAKGFAQVERSTWTLAPLDPSLAPPAPELEAALHADLNDAAAWAVYADWLATQDAIWGERLALELSESNLGQLLRLGRLRAEHGTRWYGPDLDRLRAREDLGHMLQCDLRHGFITTATLRTAGLDNRHWGNPSLDFVLAALLRAPATRLLRYLKIHIDPDPREGRLEACMDVLRTQGQLTGLRVLSFESSIRWPLTARLGPLDPLLARVPELRQLTLQGYDVEFEPLVHPELQSLQLRTSCLPPASIQALAHSELPKCERIELGLGRWDASGPELVEALTPLLDGRVAPRLRHLTLRDTDLGDALFERLLHSPLSAQLWELSLSSSELSDASVRRLIEHIDRFPELQTLGLGGNQLSRSTEGDLHRLRNSKTMATRLRRVDFNPERPIEITPAKRELPRYWPQKNPPLP